jgi:hypothetical protein
MPSNEEIISDIQARLNRLEIIHKVVAIDYSRKPISALEQDGTMVIYVPIVTPDGAKQYKRYKSLDFEVTGSSVSRNGLATLEMLLKKEVGK